MFQVLIGRLVTSIGEDIDDIGNIVSSPIGRLVTSSVSGRLKPDRSFPFQVLIGRLVTLRGQGSPSTAREGVSSPYR